MLPETERVFIFHNTAKHKKNNTTITTAAWRVARKADQPIRAGKWQPMIRAGDPETSVAPNFALCHIC